MAPKPAFNRSAFEDLAVDRAHRISHQYVYLSIYIYIEREIACSQDLSSTYLSIYLYIKYLMAPKPAFNRSAFKHLAINRTHRNMYIYLYVFIYMCMSIYLSIYIHMHIYIYIFT